MCNNKFYNNYIEHYKRAHLKDFISGSLTVSPEELAKRPWIPKDKNTQILDIGCGWGHKLLEFQNIGFNNITGIELTKEASEIAKNSLKSNVNIICGDAIEIIDKLDCNFGLVLCMDVLEHFSAENAFLLLSKINKILSKNGVLVIRTPNMSSLFGLFSRYLDITHLTGYTEFSIRQLAEATGYERCELIKISLISYVSLNNWRPWKPWKGLGIQTIFRSLVNRIIHNTLFWLRGQQTHPSCWDINLEVVLYK